MYLSTEGEEGKRVLKMNPRMASAVHFVVPLRSAYELQVSYSYCHRESESIDVPHPE
jgi:hypothetical protein